MTFPVPIRIGSLALHPHWVFESLAWILAIVIFRHRRRKLGEVVNSKVRWLVSIAAVVGGVIGARLLSVFEHPAQLATHWADPAILLAGKTIVGGLIGGLIAVEWMKRRLGVTTATGDLLVAPLIVGIAVGRIGCFLTGLADQTFGTSTSLPWGVDFGDGIRRHPTQLYESAFLMGLGAWLVSHEDRLAADGDTFKLFMAAYMSFRFVVDFFKPAARIGGLSVIQWACIAMIAFYAPHLPRITAAVRHEGETLL